MDCIEWSEANEAQRASALALLDAVLRAFPDAGRWRDPFSDEFRLLMLGGSGNETAGCAVLWPVDSRRFRMDLIVSPTNRGRGAGSQLIDRVLQEAAGRGARTVQARCHATDEAARWFLARRGFRETLCYHRFAIDPALARLPSDTETRIEAHGIAIRTLANELESTTDVYARLAAVYDAAADDWPDPDPGPKTALTEEGVRAMFHRWRAIPDAVFIARTPGEYAGFTGLCEGGKSVGTAVRPAFRGMGLATALKVRLIRWAIAMRVPRLHSVTAHPAMIRLNGRLGYALESIEVRLVRSLP